MIQHSIEDLFVLRLFKLYLQCTMNFFTSLLPLKASGQMLNLITVISTNYSRAMLSFVDSDFYSWHNLAKACFQNSIFNADEDILTRYTAAVYMVMLHDHQQWSPSLQWCANNCAANCVCICFTEILLLLRP